MPEVTPFEQGFCRSAPWRLFARKAVAESVRVLRPGGRLLGFDLLASRPMHWLHQAERSTHRMIRWDELRRETQGLPLLGVLNRSLGGLTVRFVLQERL